MPTVEKFDWPTKSDVSTHQPRRLSSLFLSVLVLLSMHAVNASKVFAANDAVIKVGSGRLDHAKITGPRWTRLLLEPLRTSAQTIRVVANGNADNYFSIFQIPDENAPTKGVRLATTSGSATPDTWTGSLEISKRHYVGVWTTSGAGDFTVTIEAEATSSPDSTITPRQFSKKVDSSTYMLQGPAPTLDYKAKENSRGWGNALLRIGNALLVGGDFTGIQASRSANTV